MSSSISDQQHGRNPPRTSSSSKSTHTSSSAGQLVASQRAHKRRPRPKTQQSSSEKPAPLGEAGQQASRRLPRRRHNQAGLQQLRCVCLDKLNPNYRNEELSFLDESSKLEKSSEELDDNSQLGHYSTSYEADDEDPNETFFFPCHQTFDDCQTGQLSDQHYEYLQLSRRSFYVIKYPRMFEHILESMFKELRTSISLNCNTNSDSANKVSADEGDLSSTSCDIVCSNRSQRVQTIKVNQFQYHLSVNFKPIIALVRKLTKICLSEKRNCIILSETGMLNILMREILFLIQELPEKQCVYLEPLIKFALTLCDNKVTGTNLKQLFNIIKNENTDLKIVLEELDKILENQQQRQHQRILHNRSLKMASRRQLNIKLHLIERNQSNKSATSKDNESDNRTGMAKILSTRSDFGSALVEAGGIESFLMFFAEVIRRVQMDSYTHSLAFSILLRMSQTNSYHLSKFLEELNGLKMAEFILVHPKCFISKRMLDSYFEFCFSKQNTSMRLIRSSNLIYSLMNCWRAWHKDLKIAKLFYRRLIKLLEPPSKSNRDVQPANLRLNPHPEVSPVSSQKEIHYACHNYEMINNAGGIDILIGILRECLVPLDETVPAINHELVRMIVQLISMLIKDPPGLDVLLDIKEFLLFLHPDPKSYVEVTYDKTAYLHKIDETSDDKRLSFDDDECDESISYEARDRTPLSDTSQSIRSSSVDFNRQRKHHKGFARRKDHRQTLIESSGDDSADSSQEFDGRERANFSKRREGCDRFDSQSTFQSSHERISDKCDQNLAELISEVNVESLMKNMPMNKAKTLLQADQQLPSVQPVNLDADESDKQYHKCSNRNYAISIIADLLASIVKRTSIESTKVLSEALQKSIIDPKKLIILANNNSTLVRERIFRLFLYCIKSCYSSSSLGSLLSKYEQEQSGNSFKVCLPMQLMARQLLKYPVTNKMMQLCYAIIVGVNDSGLSEQLCLTFEIDTSNNGLQMNTLVLLIQLMTRLHEPKDVSQALDFVYTYLQRLAQYGQESVVKALIKSELVDSMMKLYFMYVESKINLEKQNQGEEQSFAYDDYGDEVQLLSDVPTASARITEYEQVKSNLNRMLLFIVQYYVQNQSTSETTQSIEELLRYFDLLNTFITSDSKYIMRDCQVRVLTALLKYCKHYERCSKQKVYSGRVDYYLRSLFKNSHLNRFNNMLPLSQLTSDEFDLLLNGNDLGQDAATTTSKSSINSFGSSNQLNGFGDGQRRKHNRLAGNEFADSNYRRRNTMSTSDDGNISSSPTDSNTSDSFANRSLDDQIEDEVKEISVADVVQRFKSTMDFIVNFITTRPAGAIPSPEEREFVINFIRLLARFTAEHHHSLTSSKLFSFSQVVLGASGVTGVQGHPKSHWSMMLAELEPSISAHFTRLILYLMSTCESMNMDERKYYTHKLLDIFSVEELLNLLHKFESSSNSKKSTYKILLVFLKDLIDRSSPLLLINQSSVPHGETHGANGEDSDLNEDELIDEMEIKLRQLVRGLEYELGLASVKHQLGSIDKKQTNGKRIKFSNSSGSPVSEADNKLHSEIWLVELRQLRLDASDRLRLLKLKIQQTSITSSQNASSAATNSTLSSLSLSSALIGTDATNTISNSGVADESNSKLLDEAVSITRDVINDKNEQRKTYLEDVKQGKVYNYHVRQQWLSLIISHTHERAVWHMEKYYPKSWELNPVEGPSRTRRRLRPCKLTLESRFLRKSTSGGSKTGNATANSQTDERPNLASTSSIKDSQDDLVADDWFNQYSPHPLCSLVINNEQSMDCNELKIRMFTTDKIHFNCDCSIIRPNEVCDGEVSIASWCIHFIGEKTDGYQKHLSTAVAVPTSSDGNPSQKLIRRHISNLINTKAHATTPLNSKRVPTYASTIVEDLWFDEIVEIWDRRYQLQDVGLEVFLTNNMTYLLSFKSNHDREEFKQNLMREQHKMINLQRFNLTTSLNRLTQFWREGKMTNFDYLTCLNKLAGRSFNDLMQYPIFPFVLSNYTTDYLDLNNSDNFRKLKRPMAIQDPDREANFVENYKSSQSANIAVAPCGLAKPYHYSNHYSNSATVLHFLVRLPPFTQMLIQYQDNNFDQPDRTYHSVANTWQLITRDSNTDFKELIPEFFFLPEMFINIENLELGRKQNNELVDDVQLPAWCPNSDARLFTLIHRQALESAYVSESLHHWIDLIFGYKQTGNAAVEAINVFHPATYYGGIDFTFHQQQQATTAVANSVVSAINTPTNSKLANISSALSKSPSNYSSDNVSTAETTNQHQAAGALGLNYSITKGTTTVDSSDTNSLKRSKFVDIERSALETMIRTYGQMPRQLFTQPMKQRSPSNFVPQFNENRLEQHQSLPTVYTKPIEPLERVKGLKWGNYVGSPCDTEIIAVKHKMISPVSKGETSEQRPKQKGRHQQKYHLSLLSNGDIVILKSNCSLMLDYRADRKSGGTYQLSIPSARYTARRAGLSNVARMNLFSNMIISRQQFSFLEPIYSAANNQLDTLNTASSTIVSFSGASRVKYTPEALSLISWPTGSEDDESGPIRFRHPATNMQEASKPLVQGNTIVDKMSTCCSIPELNLLLVGYHSGSICAHIISTSYETQLAANNRPPTPSTSSSTTSMALNVTTAVAISDNAINYSAAPSAVHFLHTTGSNLADRTLGPGKLVDDFLTGEPIAPVSLAGKTLQSVRAMNKASRWLYCHSRRVNCIKINISFGIVVTGSDDGTSVIWDLNSLAYVRTIDYKFGSLRMQRNNGSISPDVLCPGAENDLHDPVCHWTFGHANKQRMLDYLCCCNMKQVKTRSPSRLSGNKDVDAWNQTSSDMEQCCICSSGINLITISDTLGDIVTIKDISNRLAETTEATNNDGNSVDGIDSNDRSGSLHSSPSNNDEYGQDDRSTSASVEGDLSHSNNSEYADTLTSVLYVHTINGALIGFVNCHTKVTAVCYSNAPEGISINVILVGLADGLIRLYSSWDLSRVKEFRVSGFCSPISSLLYSRDSQLLYVTYENGQLVVLRNKKKKSPQTMPKELYL